MTTTHLLAKHLREVYFGGNWTSVNLKQTLVGVNWQQATTKVHSLNTITALVYHINYYVSAILNVLDGEPLTSKNAYSFDHPPIQSAEDWEALVNKSWRDAEMCASLMEQLEDEMLEETFVDEKYGTYHRNFLGLIEHTHYHLGQNVLIKKMIGQS